jgi:hypothetical protein
MRSLGYRSLIEFALVGALLAVAACGATHGSTNGSGGSSAGGGGSGSGGGGATGGSGGTPAVPFAGSGTAGQSQVITTGISPMSCGATSAFNGTTIQVVGGDNVTCYYSASVSATTPLGFIEQDEEVIGGKDLIHVRLTLNPAFVDNTYGANAVGWGGTDAGGAAPAGPGAHGHTFHDLIDSDHCEFDFEDASGNVVLSFDEDYCSADANAPSGYACLGVSGGDGGMLVGSAQDIVYYSSSLARDLNACGYGSYTTDSPATDASYTPNPAAPNWDFRVVYDVWVLKSALPTGWTVSIPYVHASPSKLASTYTVTAAPCPPLGCVGEGCNPGGTCVGPWCDAGGDGCVGEGCNSGGTCVGAYCDSGAGDAACVGEGCNAGGACYGLLCDSGSPTECIGEACNSGGACVGLLCDAGTTGSWCTTSGGACTDDSACCSALCIEGACK